MSLTLRYLDDDDAQVTDTTVTNVSPVLNGVSYLVTNATTNYVIPVRKVIDIFETPAP